jgi:hypothetical protein
MDCIAMMLGAFGILTALGLGVIGLSAFGQLYRREISSPAHTIPV